jgi:hypothetical protein
LGSPSKAATKPPDDFVISPFLIATGNRLETLISVLAITEEIERSYLRLLLQPAENQISRYSACLISVDRP